MLFFLANITLKQAIIPVTVGVFQTRFILGHIKIMNVLKRPVVAESIEKLLNKPLKYK